MAELQADMLEFEPVADNKEGQGMSGLFSFLKRLSMPKARDIEWGHAAIYTLLTFSCLSIGGLSGWYAHGFVLSGCSVAKTKLERLGYHTEASALEEQMQVCSDDKKMTEACLALEGLKRHPEISLWPKKESSGALVSVVMDEHLDPVVPRSSVEVPR